MRIFNERKNEFSYKIIDEHQKKVEIKYKGKTLRLQLKVKRSFTVLKELLKAYPGFFNIHDLDNTLSDPNKAHSELRITDGFDNFLIGKKGKKQVTLSKIDIDKLFEFCRTDTKDDEYICLAAFQGADAVSESIKKEIYAKFEGRCNITGLKLYEKTPSGQIFLKHVLTPAYDHRRPKSKNGKDEKPNYQLISTLANNEKNKICNSCNGKDCERCALAYPEKFNIILPTNQNIKDLRYKTEKN